MSRVTAALAAWLVMATSVLVCAQGLPSEPLSIGGGRLVVGAEFSATAAPDDEGFFNYTDYETNALRNVRAGISAKVHAAARLQILGEVRLDGSAGVVPLALYARVRPWPQRPFDVHIGRIPPTFGASSRSPYGSANIMIATPLAYQYLTSLRTDALPQTTADLVRMRGRGWLSSFPLGNRAEDRGLPLVNTTRWDTGVQVHAVNGTIEWAAAVTMGSLSNPRVDDDNDGRQVSGRAIWRPQPSWAVGTSFARGAFLDAALDDVLPAGRRAKDGVQQAIGADVEYSAGHLLTRAEWIRSGWTLPLPLAQASSETLVADAALVEARYRLAPGLQVGARLEQLTFGDVATASGAQPWEARVRRLEVGGGYSVLRNVTLKASWQRSRRDGGRVRRADIGVVQLLYWF